MEIFYPDIKFTIDDVIFNALKIVDETFSASIPNHSHGNNSYEIHYVPEGNGFLNISGTAYRIIPNTLYVTGPHFFHEQITSKDNPMREYCIYFNLQLPPHKIKDTASIAACFINTPFWFGQDKQNILRIMQQIFLEMAQKRSGYILLVESLLQEFVVKMVRNYENRSPVNSKKNDPMSLEDHKYVIVEESFLYSCGTLTLEELSKKLGLSSRQTERFLLDCYGKNFMQKKAEAKMSSASILLEDCSLSVSDIADKLNFSSLQHFSYSFKQYYHVTPTAWRKKMGFINNHPSLLCTQSIALSIQSWHSFSTPNPVLLCCVISFASPSPWPPFS